MLPHLGSTGQSHKMQKLQTRAEPCQWRSFHPEKSIQLTNNAMTTDSTENVNPGTGSPSGSAPPPAHRAYKTPPPLPPDDDDDAPSPPPPAYRASRPPPPPPPDDDDDDDDTPPPPEPVPQRSGTVQSPTGQRNQYRPVMPSPPHDTEILKFNLPAYLKVKGCDVELSDDERMLSSRCPLHESESFCLTARLTNNVWRWNCSACGAYGTIIDLGAKLYHLDTKGSDFTKIRERLTEELRGVKLSVPSFPRSGTNYQKSGAVPSAQTPPSRDTNKL